MSYLDEELRKRPAHVSWGSIIVAQIAGSGLAGSKPAGSRAPTSPTDVVGVTLPALAEPTTTNPNPVAPMITLAFWAPQPGYALVNGVWTASSVTFPQVGDYALCNFDSYGQLWALAWVAAASYQVPTTGVS